MTVQDIIKELKPVGNLQVHLNGSILSIPVRIVDARRVWSRIDVQVEYDGQRAWVSRDSVIFE